MWNVAGRSAFGAARHRPAASGARPRRARALPPVRRAYAPGPRACVRRWGDGNQSVTPNPLVCYAR